MKMNNKKKEAIISKYLKTKAGRKKLADSMLGGMQFRMDARDDFMMWFGVEFAKLEAMLYTAAESLNETFFIGMLDRCLEMWFAYHMRDEIFDKKVFPRAVRNFQCDTLDEKAEEAAEQIRKEEDQLVFKELRKAAATARKRGKKLSVSKIKKIVKSVKRHSLKTDIRD